ncbi:hypothetical protein M407DRAFT_27168 [Tulasnella calospora MUT 4182]|uniref:Uncharacterized protein n=1 Tax=Tulasnella calospora MUT 4182 TaxID=1051891 RepID=A0A0C3KPV6_9AGAM|nr:hypothetical protein M407DRAFT_27168 [Tulasnella calospora MUT 4182]
MSLQLDCLHMASAGAPDIVFRGQDGNESRLRQGALRWFARLEPSKKKDWDLFVEALFEQYPPVEASVEAEISTPVWSAMAFSPSASTAILPSDQVLGLQPNMQDESQAIRSRTGQSVLSSSRTYDPSIRGRHIGVLRLVVEDGTTAPQYICRGRPPTISSGSTRFEQTRSPSFTMDRQEALVVCFIPSSEPHPIGCLNDVYGLGYLSLDFSPLRTKLSPSDSQN